MLNNDIIIIEDLKVDGDFCYIPNECEGILVLDKNYNYYLKFELKKSLEIELFQIKDKHSISIIKFHERLPQGWTFAKRKWKDFDNNTLEWATYRGGAMAARHKIKAIMVKYPEQFKKSAHNDEERFFYPLCILHEFGHFFDKKTDTQYMSDSEITEREINAWEFALKKAEEFSIKYMLKDKDRLINFIKTCINSY